MIVGIDTATAATAAAVWAPGGPEVEVRDDPDTDPTHPARPAHAARLLALVEEALERAGAGWDDVERIAVGVGPGGFTGLRHGIATARALAQARDLPVVGVSSLEALARGAAEVAAAGGDPALGAAEGGLVAAGARPVLAVIDARRGEVFAAAWRGAERLLDPVAIRPEDLAARIAEGGRASCSAACGRRRGDTLQGAARAGRGRRPGGPLSRSSRQRAPGVSHRSGGGARRQGRARPRLPPRARRLPAETAPISPPSRSNRPS